MKQYLFAVFLCIPVLFGACLKSPIPPGCRLLLPELPLSWQGILEEPHWRLEWVNTKGVWQEMDLKPGEAAPKLSLMIEWTTPVFAWPYWPERGLFPGLMRPAGALFPWDYLPGKNGASVLALSWQGGVDAFFWKELAKAERLSAASEARLPGIQRVPWYFDWQRFRDLFCESGTLAENVRTDPWLADWTDIAERTILNGFDRRRISSRQFTEINIPGLDGRWIGSSPFALPLYAEPGSPLSIMASERTEVFVSINAVLKCSTAAWILLQQ